DVEVRALPFFLRDDAGGEGLVEAKWRTHREHPIADLRGVGIAKRHGRQISRRVDLDHGYVRFGIETDDRAAKPFGGLQADGDPGGIFDDVIVRENVTLRIDDKPATDASRRRTSLAAKHVEQWIAGRLVFFVLVFYADLGRRLGGFDVDHR